MQSAICNRVMDRSSPVRARLSCSGSERKRPQKGQTRGMHGGKDGVEQQRRWVCDGVSWYEATASGDGRAKRSICNRSHHLRCGQERGTRNGHTGMRGGGFDVSATADEEDADDDEVCSSIDWDVAALAAFEEVLSWDGKVERHALPCCKRVIPAANATKKEPCIPVHG